ncbi:MAG: hypothetical protein OEY11_06545 [Gammaproteobacteria bacterium]|nr:hypothetical protein [Gammaproteobacteria bacterium]
MMQNENNVSGLNVTDFEQVNFNGGAVIRPDGTQVFISEGAVQQSLRELESVWMKHHNHYADVLDSLMQTVNAARGVV